MALGLSQLREPPIMFPLGHLLAVVADDLELALHHGHVGLVFESNHLQAAAVITDRSYKRGGGAGGGVLNPPEDGVGEQGVLGDQSAGLRGASKGANSKLRAQRTLPSSGASAGWR